MMRRLLTGNGAAAWAARLARVDYVPAFPITPQTEILETLAGFFDRGEMRGRLVTYDSEHSMITGAGSAAAAGVRVFTATSSQGLLLAIEMLYTVAGWRAPFVLVNVSRGVSAPITLEADHTDVLATRDSGFLQIHCATCQEVLDSVLMAYAIAEHPDVRLPVLVNMDGFYLSFTREPVEVPSETEAREIVGELRRERQGFRASSPQSQAVAVLGGPAYSYFRYEMHRAAQNAIAVHEEVAERIATRWGRRYHALESYFCEDAEYLFVMLGAFSTKGQAAVDLLREEGWRIGLLRPRLFRPFPAAELREALTGKRAVGVIDQSLSIGSSGGVLYHELRSALYGEQQAPPVLGFIGGLGGRNLSQADFRAIADSLRSVAEGGAVPPPRLLFTESELRQVRTLQVAAGARNETGRPLPP